MVVVYPERGGVQLLVEWLVGWLVGWSLACLAGQMEHLSGDHNVLVANMLVQMVHNLSCKCLAHAASQQCAVHSIMAMRLY